MSNDYGKLAREVKRLELLMQKETDRAIEAEGENLELRQRNHELVETLEAVSHLDYLQEHNALAEKVRKALANQKD